MLTHNRSHRHARRLFPCFLLLALACISFLTAHATADSELTLDTERVIVFKDGYALIIKHGTATADETGMVYTDAVPSAATLGCFWAVTEGDDALAMSAEWVETSEITTRTTPCTNTIELLRANAGHDVTLELNDGRHLVCTLVEILELPPEAPAHETASTSGGGRLEVHHALHGAIPVYALSGPGELVRDLIPQGGQLLVIETKEHGQRVLPIGSVRSLWAPQLETRMERRKQTMHRTKRLTFDFGPEHAGQDVTLRLMHFSPGMRCIPTYRLTGDLEEAGVLSLQAELLNELEDLHEAELDLVVGVPNFRFKDVVSPMVLERALHRALNNAAPQLMGQQRSMGNAYFQSRAGEWRETSDGASDASVMELAPELASAAHQDLFVYSLGKVSLSKGARATIPLWKHEIPIKHVFTLETQLMRNAHSGAVSVSGPDLPDIGTNSPLRLSPLRVWHQLELRNTADVPWTTGAALMLRDMLPIAQELLTYTPPGAQSMLPVTVAVDVRASHKEEETERIPNHLNWNHNSYHLIKKRGTFTITNHRDETIDLRVQTVFGGKAETASDGGDITINDSRPVDWQNGWHQLNNHSDIVWSLTLSPGETRELTYTCHYYIR